MTEHETVVISSEPPRRSGLFTSLPVVIVALMSGALGVYLLLNSFAATTVVPTAANLWVDTSGGSCARQATAASYSDGTACASLQAAWSAAAAGDTVVVKAGTYGIQDIPADGTKAVTFYGQTGTKISQLFARSANLTFDSLDLDAGGQKITNAVYEPSAANITFKNGRIGNVVDEKGSLAGDNCTGCTYDNVQFHDVIVNTDGVHNECLYSLAPNLTVKNSTFTNCATMDIFFTRGTWYGQPTYGGFTLTNNFFGKTYQLGGQAAGLVHYYTVVWANNSPIDRAVVRNNTFELPISADANFTNSVESCNSPSSYLNLTGMIHETCDTTPPPPSPGDTTPPTVTMTAPVAGSTVGGNVTVAASASDAVGVAGVQFQVDGTNVGTEDTSSPYSISWNSASVANGSHTLQAIARDASGNTATSSATTITVNNTSTPPPSGTALLGNQTVESFADTISAGQVEAWPFTASSGAVAGSAAVYLDATSTASTVNVGLYSDAGGTPGSLLAQTAITAPKSGWNTAGFGTEPTITQGNSYWLAVLGSGSGQVVVRDRNGGGNCSAKVNATPNDWTSLRSSFGVTGGDFTQCPLSAYVLSGGTSDATPPSVPQNTVQTGATESTLSLSWSASSDNVSVAGYKLYKNGVLDGTTTATTYTYRNLTCGTAYTVALTAFDAAGNESDKALNTGVMSTSNCQTDTTPPTVAITAPSNGSTVSGLVTVAASATDSSGSPDGTGISKVEFYVDGALRLTDAASSYNYTIDTATLSNGSHSFMAKAYDSSNNAASATVTITVSNNDTTPPNAPTGLVAVVKQPTASNPASEVTLTWQAATDNSGGSGIKGYYVYRDGVVVSALITSGLTYSDKNVASGSYTYTVRSVDNANLTSTTAAGTTPALTIINQPADDIKPSTPANVSAVAASSTLVNLSWNTSTDTGGSNLKGYNVYRNGSTAPLNGSSLITSTSYGDGTVAAGTTYSYVVEAVDGAGNKSPLSAAASVTVPAAPAPVNQLLIGEQSLQPNVESIHKGQAEAFRATAVASGTGVKFSLYLDSGSSARSVKVGVYTNSNNHPSTLLSQAAITSPLSGAWNTVNLSSTYIVAGQTYWIAVLNPNSNSKGTLRYRDSINTTANRSETSYQTNLSGLPSTWRTGTGYDDGPLSGYISQ